MQISDRTLLRLHVEAVWGVRLSASALNEIELARDTPQPKWRLCAADMAEGRVYIWRADVTSIERAALRLKVSDALAGMPDDTPLQGIDREVALSLAAHPRLDKLTIHDSVRPLTEADQLLLEVFDPGWQSYYFSPARQPLIGAVIAGQLMSVAHSSRRTSEACELGVHTLPEARRKGYALAVTVAWTQGIMQKNLIPLYSADAANTASLRLADAAGYRAFAHIATFE
jgi:RimJ/RimL family protein N-acetyltransferase